MQITETGSASLRKNYRIVIEAADIARATEAELKELGKQVKIPGFRPGYVPIKVLRQRYGKSVQNDVLKTVVNDATQRVITDHKLKLALAPDVKVEDYQEDGDLVFTMAVDTMPEVPALSFEGIAIEREVFDIDGQAIEDALSLLAQRNPVPVPLEGRAEEGHQVTMDFTGYVDGTPFEGGAAENFSLVLGSNRLIPGFEEQLAGTKAGDKKTVNVAFPDNYFNKELAGKPAAFEVTVREVAKLETPAVDEEFAKARSFESLSTLRDAVREQLKKDYGAIVRTRLKKRLFDALEDMCAYDLPAGMVKMEFDTIWDRLQQAGKQDASVYEGKPEEEVKTEYRKIAERRVRLGILLAELGQRQKLEVTREELTRALIGHAGQFPGREQAVFEFYRKNPQRLDDLRGPILEEKAVDWILERVMMKDTPVTLQELSEDEEDSGAEATGNKEKPAKTQSKKKAAAGKKKTDAPDNG